MYKVPPCKNCNQSFYVRGSENRREDRTGRAPLVLDCGHNFCEQCLSKMASVAKTEINCFACQTITPLREGHSVKSVLPVNAYLVGQTMLSKQLLLDDSVLKMVPKVMKTPSPGVKPVRTRLPKQEPCGECSVNAATCQCYKCDCVLCGTCFDKVHQASKMLRTHQAIPLYESDRYEKIATVCPEHDNRPIEYFCEDDQTAICSHCVIVGKHQNHAINSIEDKNKEAVKKIDPALSQAQTVFQMLKRSDKQLHGVIPNVQKDVQSVIDEIRNQFLHIHSLLIAREMALIHDIERICLEEVAPIEEMRAKVSEDLQKVASITRDAAKLKQSTSLSVLNAQAILDSLNKLDDMPCYAEIQPLPDSGIKCQFDHEELLQCIRDYGKLEGSAAVSIKLLNLNDVPDDLLETSSITSDSTSVVSSERPSLPKEGSGGDDAVDSASIMSDTSAVDSIEGAAKPSYPKGLRRSRINLSRREMVCVTHIKNPSNFMIQKLAIMDDLNKLSRKINQYCARPDTASEIPLNGLEPEAIVLAQFNNDSMWYRARVLTYEFNEEEPLKSQVEVMYVDYGNSEIIPLSRIRKIPSKFTYMPALAMRCALYEVLPANDNLEWSLDSIKALVGLISDKPMLCMVKSEQDGILQVDLSVPPDEKIEMDQPLSIRDALVFLEFAWFKSTAATPIYPGGPIPKPTRQYLKPSRAALGTNITCIVSHVNNPYDFFIQQLGEEAQYLTNMMQALQEQYGAETGDLWSIFCPQKGMLCASQYTVDDQWYRAEVANIPGRRNVEVLYVDYGNTEIVPFWRLKKITSNFLILPVQALRFSLKDVEPIDRIKGWQEEAITFMRQLVFKPLSACVAGYGPTQLQIVLKETSTGQDICINAGLVQHGYARSTGPGSFLDELQVVPEKLVSSSPPSQFQDPFKAAPYMASSNFNISRDGKKSKHSSTSSSPIPRSASPSVGMEFRKAKSESPKSVVKQTGGYKSAERKSKSELKDVPGTKPTHMQIVVSHVISPGHFYIQPCSKDELSEMMIAIQNQYREREVTQADWSPGDYCMAVRPEDVRWYRAQILEMDNEEAKVFLPDYGFTETVSVRRLRTLDEEFHSQPVNALQCHLAEICPAGDITKWSQTACETFQDIVKEKTCYIVSKGELEGASLPVDILIKEFIAGDALNPDRVEHNSVSQKLLKKGVALPDRKTIGRLIAAEEAKASLVTIPPKPLVPSAYKTADESAKNKSDAQSPIPQQNDLTTTDESQENASELDMEVKDDLLESGEKLIWVNSIDAEEKCKQEQDKKERSSAETAKTESTRSNSTCKESESAQVPDDAPSAEVQNDNTSTDKSSPSLDKREMVRDETKIENHKDSVAERGSTSPSSKKSSSRRPSSRSKGCSISDKLKAQQKRKNSLENQDTAEASKDGAGDYVHDAVRNEKSTKAKELALKDDEILKELDVPKPTDQQLPEAFVEPSPPTSDELEVVPTYVNYSGIIYGHVVPHRESSEGRFGFILKERSLETIIQDRYLKRKGLCRAKIPRDGNCLFRAFAQGVYQDQGRQSELRKLTVDMMSRDWDVIQESVGVESKEAYLTAMQQDGSYGGEPEIQMLCTVLDVQAVVQIGGLNYPIQWRTYGQDSSKFIQLVYISDGNYDGGHYDLAVTSQEEADEVNVVYEKWREMRVKQLQSFGAYEDNSTCDESLLGQLMDHLQKCHENSYPDFDTTFYPGRPVVCMYTDGCFYRALVEEVLDDGVKLLYVDFGNSEKILPDQIRTKNILSEIPIQCYKFVLHDILPNSHDLKWPVKTLEYIHNLVVTKQCTVNLQKPPVEGKPLEVSMTMEDGKDLGHHLVEMGLTLRKSKMAEALAQVPTRGAVEGDGVISVSNAYQPMWDPYIGTIAAVVVTHVESANEVYLQRSLCDSEEDPVTKKVNACLHKLATMTEELQTQAEFYPKLSDIKPGAACCALYDVDNRWYRGVVVSMEMGATPQVVVLFVDYGNKELVAPEYVRAPPDDMIILPAQASLCKLAGVSPPIGHNDWLPETKECLTQFVVSKCLVASVKSLDGSIEVNLFEYHQFHEECLEERTDLLVYYPMIQAGLIQIHNVTEDGVVIENEEEDFS